MFLNSSINDQRPHMWSDDYYIFQESTITENKRSVERGCTWGPMAPKQKNPKPWVFLLDNTFLLMHRNDDLLHVKTQKKDLIHSCPATIWFPNCHFLLVSEEGRWQKRDEQQERKANTRMSFTGEAGEGVCANDAVCEQNGVMSG